MPFEPLQTDEKLDQPVKADPDMDTAMLFGCSGFVFTSIGGYILSVWPYLVFQDSEILARLAMCSAIGLTPSALLGIAATRRFGLAGACGFVGGSMATGIFLFLRLDQAFVAALARQAPKPDYPHLLVYLVPAGWIILTLILALVFMPNEEPEK
ncbi:MAG: hypothetical protein P4L46_14670 [Fimbriimonas sp.]|nr:hypothetical protein [Fimbriimonas sp.]